MIEFTDIVNGNIRAQDGDIDYGYLRPLLNGAIHNLYRLRTPRKLKVKTTTADYVLVGISAELEVAKTLFKMLSYNNAVWMIIMHEGCIEDIQTEQDLFDLFIHISQVGLDGILVGSPAMKYLEPDLIAEGVLDQFTDEMETDSEFALLYQDDVDKAKYLLNEILGWEE